MWNADSELGTAGPKSAKTFPLPRSIFTLLVFIDLPSAVILSDNPGDKDDRGAN